MSKISKAIEKDYRGGKLGKVQKIADELISDAIKAYENAKEIGIDLIETENSIVYGNMRDQARTLLMEREVKLATAKRITDLLGQKPDDQSLNMDHIEV